MKEVAEDEDSSDISGYHSDSDSAIMMSGNSPYVTKRARHNFISRSGKLIRYISRVVFDSILRETTTIFVVGELRYRTNHDYNHAFVIYVERKV